MQAEINMSGKLDRMGEPCVLALADGINAAWTLAKKSNTLNLTACHIVAGRR